MPLTQTKPTSKVPPRLPEPPPLRVVRKGWFTDKETTATVEEVKRANEERREKHERG